MSRGISSSIVLEEIASQMTEPRKVRARHVSLLVRVILKILEGIIKRLKTTKAVTKRGRGNCLNLLTKFSNGFVKTINEGFSCHKELDTVDTATVWRPSAKF
jgi:hypothetical protein